MFKRARSSSVPRGPKRATDKKIIQIYRSANAAVTQDVVFTAPVACTMVGFRIKGNAMVSSVAPVNRMNWAVQYIREGQALVDITPQAINTTGVVQTEQNILYMDTFGNNSLANADQPYPVDVVVKAKRKMLAGDSILFITDSLATNNNLTLTCIVTVFIKQ